MSVTVAAHKRTRAGTKSKLTRFRQYIDTFVPDIGNLEELRARLEKAEDLLTEFNNIQDKIRIIDADDTLLDELNAENDLFEGLFYDVIARARRLASTRAIPNNHQDQNGQGALANLMPQNNQIVHHNVKIPTIALPHFDGSYEKWHQFYDLFIALVDSDQSLSNVQKFYYLQSVLKDQAAQVIHSLAITGDNYTVALELLKQRFENKRLTTGHHVRALFELPQVQKESAFGLRALSDELCKHLRALKNLGEPVESWDTLLIEMVLNKLDPLTKREWEQKVISDNFSTVNKLKEFLSNRCQILEAIQQKKGKEEYSTKTQSGSIAKQKSDHSTSHVSTNSQNNCVVCQEDHKIYRCQKLCTLSIQERINEVKRLNLCLNCLGKGHTMKNCKAGNCKHCNKKHNSLLHLDDRSNKAQQISSGPRTNNSDNSGNRNEQTSSTSENPITSISTCTYKRPSQVLLSTAIVYIMDKSGLKIEARALLDSGSQSNFITRALSDRLNLPIKKIQQSVGAIAQAVTQISAATSAIIKSKLNEFSIKLSFSVLEEITDKIPLATFDSKSLKIPSHVILADPNYNIPQNIDLLIGAGAFWDLLCAEQIKSGKNRPVIQKTKLGWIIGGPYIVENHPTSTRDFCGFSNTSQLHDQLQRFWQIEEIQAAQTLSNEELACEKHFQQTHVRLPSGRFEVKLPLRDDTDQLGESYGNALKRLRAVERKFAKIPLVKSRYTTFMDEYEKMNHMSLVKDEANIGIKNYLPHHAVMDEERSTTKLRVVFDASSRTTSGKALNDILMVGPVIQRELIDIVARFRQHTYVLTADITKMYRQVSVHPGDRDLQRILWRTDVNVPPRTYQLNTLTYGTGSAPFLATKCLDQLANENALTFPEASAIIKRDFYVDDLITGGSSIEELRERKMEIKKILQSAEFPLQKWKSNSRLVLEKKDDDRSTSCEIGENTKILGLRWRVNEDQLYYNVSVTTDEQRTTKRVILSFVAQLFDPLGLVGPATIRAKILLQTLWQLKVAWDESIPMDIHTKWMTYKEKLLQVNHLTVHRHVLCTQPVKVELHGFCDASTLAYGACLYLKSTNSSGVSVVRLLCAKSRVAPLKPVSLPRLELCGALLLSRLYKKMEAALTVDIHRVIHWCDSTVTLAWIRGEPSQWKEFVRNRVTEIQDLTDKDSWRHVRSEDNAADIISRGTDPDQLINAKLWWHGPDWLTDDEEYWPISAYPPAQEIPETKSSSLVFTTLVYNDEWFQKYSSLRKLNRILAYVLRFKNNSRITINPTQRQTGPLTPDEVQQAMDVLVKLAQRQEFERELNDLTNDRPINSKSKILDLHPFLDKGIIRVGGRLRNASVSYNQRFPIILPAKHQLTRLIVSHFHHRDLHAGPSALHASLRQQYWIISARNTVRSVLRKCITCFKLRPVSPTQLMGNLPTERITPSRPFSFVGVDYAGPYKIKVSRNKTAKAYLCLFVCLATKAVHLEIVSDLTTAVFLNSLKRFISRRGRCNTIHSDNGTNFVGANNEMRQFAELLSSKDHQESVIKFATDEHISWKFIPPHSPHVGGLWESAVKSAKTHAKAVIGDTSLSFEELYTVFCQVEACLNSRPLFPLSSDPSELEALTPGHFLIGTSLTSFPEEDVTDVPLNRLNRYQLIAKMQQDFWRRWSREYITQLQQRTKWKIEKSNEDIKIDAMVLLRDITPPLQWRLGRIVEVHPGKDGLIRTVSIKTQNGTIQRTLPKICVLPIE